MRPNRQATTELRGKLWWNAYASQEAKRTKSSQILTIMRNIRLALMPVISVWTKESTVCIAINVSARRASKHPIYTHFRRLNEMTFGSLIKSNLLLGNSP